MSVYESFGEHPIDGGQHQFIESGLLSLVDSLSQQLGYQISNIRWSVPTSLHAGPRNHTISFIIALSVLLSFKRVRKPNLFGPG